MPVGADLANSARRLAISSPCMLSISLLVTIAEGRGAAAAAEGTSASAVLMTAPAAGAADAAVVCVGIAGIMFASRWETFGELTQQLHL